MKEFQDLPDEPLIRLAQCIKPDPCVLFIKWSPLVIEVGYALVRGPDESPVLHPLSYPSLDFMKGKVQPENVPQIPQMGHGTWVVDYTSPR